MLCTLTIDYLCMHEFDENNDNCYVCIRDLFPARQQVIWGSTHRLSAPMLCYMYIQCIYNDHYSTKLSLFNRYMCVWSLCFYWKRRANEEESINKSCLVHQPEIKHTLLNRTNVIGRGFRFSIIIIVIIIWTLYHSFTEGVTNIKF